MQQLKELFPGIFIFVVAQVVNVNCPQAILDKLKIVFQTLAAKIRTIAVPTDNIVGMIGDIHDGFYVWQVTCATSMNLQAELDTIARTKFSDFIQWFAD